MACGEARTAQRREGTHSAWRRVGAATAGAAVGADRQGVSIRDRRGERLAGRPLQRAHAAARLPLHVRVRLHGGVCDLLDDRGRVRRLRRPLGQPRRHAFGASLAPLAKLQAYKRRMGWTFPWASSLGSDFNFDFNVSVTKEQQREGAVEYNYERGGHAMDVTPVPQPVAENAAMAGTDVATYTRERPGTSAFVLEDGVVYHTYSTYARGLDGLWGMYQWLDRAPKGRNETGVWWKRHDEYETEPRGKA